MNQEKNLAFIENVCQSVDAIEDKVQRTTALNELTRKYAVFGQYYVNVHLNKALQPEQFVQSYGALPALDMMREDYESREAVTSELPALNARVTAMEAKLDKVLSVLEAQQATVEDDTEDEPEPDEKPKPRKRKARKTTGTEEPAEPADDPESEEGAEDAPETTED